MKLGACTDILRKVVLCLKSLKDILSAVLELRGQVNGRDPFSRSLMLLVPANAATSLEGAPRGCKGRKG